MAVLYKYLVSHLISFCVVYTGILVFFWEPIMSYMHLVGDFLADVAGYNVTKCVHVQALMPDPQVIIY